MSAEVACPSPMDPDAPDVPPESSATNTRPAVRAETAGHLRTLYTIGAGISAAVAMERLLSDEGAFFDPHIVIPASLLLVAFIATLIPFFHGAMRHMHQAWDESTAPSPSLMMFDFVLLFIQTLLFFVLADLTRNPLWFTVALTILLVVDVAWLFARRTWGKQGESGLIWAKVNIPTIALLMTVLVTAQLTNWNAITLASVVALIAIGRTVADYLCARTFYFGEDPGYRSKAALPTGSIGCRRFPLARDQRQPPKHRIRPNQTNHPAPVPRCRVERASVQRIRIRRDSTPITCVLNRPPYGRFCTQPSGGMSSYSGASQPRNSLLPTRPAEQFRWGRWVPWDR